MKKSQNLPNSAIIIPFALVLLVAIAYGGITGHDFVSFDDNEYIVKNYPIHDGITADSIRWAFTNTNISYWHPVTWVSHMVDVRLFGLNPGMHHFMSLIIHLASAIVLFFSLKMMTGRLWESAFVAGLFALHPLNVESVAWASQRKNVLSALFWMLTLMAYVHYAKNPKMLRYLWLVVIFSLGLMSKPMLITLPFVLILLDFWPLQRFQKLPRFFEVAANKGSAFQKKTVWELLREKIPLFLLAALCIVTTVIAQYGNEAFRSERLIPLALRTQNAVVSYMAYIGKIFWPSRLAFFYPFPDNLPVWKTITAATVLGCITIVSLSVLRRHAYVAIGWCWFLGTFIPVIGFVQAGLWPAMADRFAYVPSIGLFILIVWVISDLSSGNPFFKRLLLPAGAAVLISLMICTVVQNRHWRDSVSLYRHATRVTEHNGVAHYGLADALEFEGNLQGALENYSAALKYLHHFDRLHYRMGRVYSRLGDFEKATAHYRSALEIKPEYPEVYSELGTLQKNRGKIGHAIKNYEKALILRPDMVAPLYDLLWIRATHGNEEYRDPYQAQRLAEDLCRLTGCQQAFSLDALAAAHAANGRYEIAVETAEKGLQLALEQDSREFAAEIGKRIELYRQGRPYRQE